MFIDLGAIRTGKSLKAAAIALTRSQTADLTAVRMGEAMPRISIASVNLDKAQVVFQHMLGAIGNSEELSKLVVSQNAKAVVIRQQKSGKLVEIGPLAGGRGGESHVGRWNAAVVFDECTLMLGSSDGRVRSLESDLRQLEGRLLPGAQILMLGSCVAPPRGPAYDIITQNFGSPTQDLVVAWATGPDALPSLYTAEHLSSLSAEVRDVVVNRAFLDPDITFLDHRVVDGAMPRERVRKLPRADGVEYVIATDPATRANAWSAVVLGTYAEHPTLRVALACEWRPPPGGKLDARDVLAEIKVIADEYGCTSVWSDRHQQDRLTEQAEDVGLEWMVDDLKPQQLVDGYLELQRVITTGELQLPRDEQLRLDLQRIRRVVTKRGQISFELPQADGGRHCDYIPSLMRAVLHAPPPPAGDVREETLDERADREGIEADERGGRRRPFGEYDFGGIFDYD
jgi:hypothetical protein